MMVVAERPESVALRGQLLLDEPMARHVSWRAGGHVERLYIPVDLDDLAVFLRGTRPGERLDFIGLGSNLLVRDGGYRGTLVHLHKALGEIRVESPVASVGKGGGFGMLYAEAGVASPKVARFAARHDLVGAEFLAGIPGTLGGALAMNAGCYGRETWEIVSQVQTINRQGELKKRRRKDFQVSYRHVEPSLPREEWFVGAWLMLPQGDGEGSREEIKSLLAKRIASQPLNMPNAGSVFRNPPGDHAARLIESCGLKGQVIGGAQVSEKHANFIVNIGNARAADIEGLIDLVETTVREKTGIRLQREVRVIGEHARTAA